MRTKIYGGTGADRPPKIEKKPVEKKIEKKLTKKVKEVEKPKEIKPSEIVTIKKEDEEEDKGATC